MKRLLFNSKHTHKKCSESMWDRAGCTFGTLHYDPKKAYVMFAWRIARAFDTPDERWFERKAGCVIPRPCLNLYITFFFLLGCSLPSVCVRDGLILYSLITSTHTICYYLRTYARSTHSNVWKIPESFRWFFISHPLFTWFRSLFFLKQNLFRNICHYRIRNESPHYVCVLLVMFETRWNITIMVLLPEQICYAHTYILLFVTFN